MFQEFLIKLSKKNKIIIVLFIGSIFLIFFTLSKKNKKQYYQNKIEKLQQLNQNNQFKKEVLDRYQKILNEKEANKWVLNLPQKTINKNLSEIIQNSKIKVVNTKDIFEEYEDFSLGQKQLQTQTSYKNLRQFIVDLKKTNVWISAIKINNTDIYSKNPQLDVVLSILHYAFVFFSIISETFLFFLRQKDYLFASFSFKIFWYLSNTSFLNWLFWFNCCNFSILF